MNVTLTFRDRSISIVASPNESILEAARRQGVALVADCTLGLCGTCKSRLVKGTVEADEPNPRGLTYSDRRAGYVLTCSVQATSDVTLEFDYASERLTRGPAIAFKGAVSGRCQVANAVMRLSIELCGDTPLAFDPGQYANIRIPGTDSMRSFSFVNAPGSKHLDFLIRVLPHGVMSDYLRTRVKLGESIEFKAPFGKFYLRPVLRPLIMVAGGTGLAPFLSMLNQLRSLAPVTKQPIRLFYGVTHLKEDLCCLEELQAFRASLPDFDFKVAVSQPHAEWTGVTGVVTDLIDSTELFGGAVDAYLCGPPRMVEKSLDVLTRLGVPREGIFNEEFLPSEALLDQT